jgi:type IX secretion system PorP/SprF family membrane protein
MKTIINMIALVLIAASGYAQQDPQFNQYIFNELVINPAYAGTKGVVNANAIYSTQWTGFSGSPSTQTVSVEGPATDNIGLGLHIVNDQIGAQSQQSVFGSYAYHLKISDKFKLSMGLAAGASYYTIDGTKLITESPSDPAIPTYRATSLQFDSKTGLFLYSDRFFAGVSVSNLLANVFKSSNPLVAAQTRQYFLTSGYVFDLSKKFKLKPSILIKQDFNAPSNIDINIFVLYNDRFWLGVTERTGARIFQSSDLQSSVKYADALVFIADFNISDRLRVGYAYTYSTSVLNAYPGSEFSLGYTIPNKITTKMSSIRYF